MRTSTGTGRRAPHGLDLALLESAEELRLEGCAHVADLVEEDDASVGQTHGALPLGDSGSDARLDAEEFGFEQFSRDGSAVEALQGAASPIGRAVEDADDVFLADTGLSCDQHRPATTRRGPNLVVDTTRCLTRALDVTLWELQRQQRSLGIRARLLR
jgi:hypothetical protein